MEIRWPKQENVMGKVMLALGVASGVLLLLPSTLFGCGESFVIFGPRVRFERVYASAHPASILIYLNPSSHLPAAEKEFQLQAMLKLAGHKPHAVEAWNDLDKALSSGSYDLVLADLSDVARLEHELPATASKPAVIPIVYNPTGAELAAAEKQHGCLVKASRKPRELLAVIDEAMQSRLKASGATCQKG
jgi:hypothetical protein